MKNRLSENPLFILSFRTAAFLFSLWGILAHTKIIGSGSRYIGFLTYTVQSNILVCVFFLLSAIRTFKEIKSGGKNFGFYAPFSFAAMIDILLTMLIFWVVLAPNNWAGLDMTSADNLAVHLVTPLLIFTDRIMFYGNSNMKKKDLLYMLIFPYIYVIESSFIGLNKIIKFGGIDGESYYLYPFLDFDRLGGMVFVNIALLTAFFMGIGYVIYTIERKRKK